MTETVIVARERFAGRTAGYRSVESERAGVAVGRSRARVVLCLLVFGALAVIAGSLIDQPEFDLVSGSEWSERLALADGAATAGLPLPAVGGDAEGTTSPAIASEWILLAGGLIVAVIALAMEARSRRSLQLRTVRNL